MFTGIVEKTGRLAQAERDPVDGRSVRVGIATGWTDLAVGESVAVNGACLTVETVDAAGLARFYVSAETLARTSLGRVFTAAAAGAELNLERAMRAGDRFSGHMVQGHVDGTAELVGMAEGHEATALRLRLPPALGRYCVEKGSVTVDGISLTVNAVHDVRDGTEISLLIIPHTWQLTNLKSRRVGDRVNIEVDLVARYIERLSEARL